VEGLLSLAESRQGEVLTEERVYMYFFVVTSQPIAYDDDEKAPALNKKGEKRVQKTEKERFLLFAFNF
jgi:hypothetical protein